MQRGIMRETESKNVLQDLLGEKSWSELGAAIQLAHRGRIRLVGHVRVNHGGALAKLSCPLLGLPQAGDNVPMEVQADHLSDRMIWQRRFSGKPLVSEFKRAGDLLVEHSGLFAVKLKPEVASRRLRYRVVGAAFAGIPLPRSLWPTLEAWEEDCEGRYGFRVAIALPWVGPTITYEGVLDQVEPA